MAIHDLIVALPGAPASAAQASTESAAQLAAVQAELAKAQKAQARAEAMHDETRARHLFQLLDRDRNGVLDKAGLGKSGKWRVRDSHWCGENVGRNGSCGVNNVPEAEANLMARTRTGQRE